MNELYYFTPFVFLNKSNDKLIIQTGVNFRVEIDYDENLIRNIKENKGFTFAELLKWFDEKQIINLFQNNILVEEKLNNTERYSRTNGYFMTSNNNNALSHLVSKKVLILGAGAIGSHVAWMLTTLGIQNLAILDFDVVEESNLNRQLLYDEYDIGNPKAEALKKHLLAINSDMQIEVFIDKIVSKEQLFNYVNKGFDFVVRAIDTPYESVEWLNSVCVELKIPYTSGGFLEYYGVVGPTYIPGITPCYSCYKNEETQQERIYGTGPTISMLTEYVASKVAFEVVNVLTQKKCSYSGCMEVYDSVRNSLRLETFEHNHVCSVCGKHWKKEHKQKDIVTWSAVYLLLIGIMGFLVSTEGWTGYGTIVSLLTVSLFTLIFENDSDAYKISFMGGTLYGVVSLALTIRLNGGMFNMENYLAAQIISIGLQILLTVSIAIVIFVGITYAYREIFRFIKKHRMERKKYVRTR